MREFIGVKSWYIAGFDFRSTIKRDALIFQRIAIPGYEWALEFAKKSESIASTLEWLFGKGVIFDPYDETLQINEDVEKLYELELERIEAYQKCVKQKAKSKLISEKEKLHAQAYAELYISAEYRVRAVSVQLCKQANFDAFPTFKSRNIYLPENNSKKTDVVGIVLNALPTPDSTTPWEQILDYRKDPESASKFLALRHWMSEVARLDLTPLEIEEKLEYLMDQYRKHMNLHKMKTNTGTLETILVTGAEIAEDLVRLKFGKIAKGLFSLKHRRISLMEAELNAPGSEIAYVTETKERFA